MKSTKATLMATRRLFLATALVAALSATRSSGAGAKGTFQNLNGPNRARLGANGQVVVPFNLMGTEPATSGFPGTSNTACRYQIWIDLGGVKQHWEFNDSAKPMFPKHPTAVFTKAGHTHVSVVAVGDTGCEGGVAADIDIDPPVTPGPSCPAGWNLVNRDDKTGAFRCAPVKPSPAPCPQGTTWFDEGGSVGCR
jgi:hypothetical protein